MKARQWKRRGFTLIETVVTIGIVATLAAVVYPQVVKQFEVADPTRIQNDLKNLQTAVETFAVNMSGVLPGDLDDLANPVTTSTAIATAPDSTIDSNGALVPYEISSWNGPYIDFSLVESGATEQGRPTAFEGTFHDNFVCFNDTDEDAGTAASPACPTPTAGDRYFLALRITGLGSNTSPAFIALNDLFDGSGATEAAGRNVLGRIRWINVGGTTPTVFFLVAPIN